MRSVLTGHSDNPPAHAAGSLPSENTDMSDQQQQQNLAQMQALLAQQAQQVQQPAIQPQMAMMPQIQPAQAMVQQQPMMLPAGQLAGVPNAPVGALVKLDLELPDGSKVGAFLQIPASAAVSPGHLQATIQQLQHMWPIRTWYPKQDRGNGGGYNRGGYNRGGYRDRGGYRR